MKNYHELTQAEAVEYARGIEDVFPDGAQLESREISDGNLNHVFHISDPSIRAGLNSEAGAALRQGGRRIGSLDA